ncbi:MAG: MarR family transcriptional regulator [Gammaproteobacteria bacterium]|nr:MarR family transcriptional regulator [Gammaproteobacteria bacterium]
MTSKNSKPVSVAQDNIGKRLAEVARWWRTALDERLRPTGLTQAKWLVLLDLKRRSEGSLQKELARNLAVECPTLVRTLDALEEANLVQRRPSKDDRRAKTVHLTARAREVVVEVEVTAAQLRDEAVKDIDPRDLDAFLRVLDGIANNIKKPHDALDA